MAETSDYRWLVDRETAPLLRELAASREPLHNLVPKLRTSYGADRARLLIEQLELRPKAVEKFGPLASQMFFRNLPLQQATDLWVARYKASRFPRGTHVIDYCTGIGGDLLALAERGPVTGWDRDPGLVLLAGANLGVIAATSSNIIQGEVEEHPPTSGELWHLDPDRRPEGRRSTQLQWHSPSQETIESWLTISPHGALKLAPATEVPTDWQSTSELEWISRGRECRQQVVWLGSLAQTPGMRRATTIVPKSYPPPESTLEESSPLYEAHSFVGHFEQEGSLASKVSEYLYDTDPAIRAAYLTGALAEELELSIVGYGENYLTGDACLSHPLMKCYRVCEVMPMRVATLKKHLRKTNIGQLEIKTRGVATRPEELRKQLKLTGSDSATLLLTRLGEREIAVLAEQE